MSKAKALPPVDLSFLKDFTFKAGSGSYADKHICIMNGLYLATEIAAGRVTLAEALSPSSPRHPYGMTPDDSVSCVSGVLTQAVIYRNDCELKATARKKWALALLPRLLGTNMGLAMEHRAEKLVRNLAQKYLVEEAKRLAEKFLKKPDNDYLIDAQQSMEAAFDADIHSIEEDEEALDYVIEGLLDLFEKERKRRASRNRRD